MEREQLAGVFFGTKMAPSPWATDCPVRFDAWLEFAQPSTLGPKRNVDLILAVNEQHGVRRVLDRLTQAQLEAPNPIAAGSFVVAKLSLDGLVRAVLPLTNLYPVIRRGQRQKPETLIAAMTTAATTDLEDVPDEIQERRQERDSQLTWLLKVLEAVVAASFSEAQGEGAPSDSSQSPPGPEESPPAPPVASGADRLLVTSMLNGALLDPTATSGPGPPGQPIADRRQRYPVVSITTNRQSFAAVTQSRSTIKCDAAEHLFSVDCRDLGWAVVDSGIDAYHDAFQDWDTSATPALRLGSRVLRAFDFTTARDVLASDATDHGLVDWARALPYVEFGGLPGTPEWHPPDPQPLTYAAPADTHGTHVAGILAGWWPERRFRGICPALRLYDFRVLDGSGTGHEFAIVAALQAIRYINEQAGRLVIAGVNLSLSVPHDVATHSCGLTPVCVECERLVRSGVVVVAAAGNAGYSGVTRTMGSDYRTVSISDPGNAELVITVGSTHRTDPHRHGVSYFSSRGPTADGRLKPDLLAPGEDIDGPLPGGGISAMHGTSQAAAHVSGAAAMLMARYRELLGRPERIKDILCSTATSLSRERDFQGYGLVDVLRAMQSL